MEVENGDWGDFIWNKNKITDETKTNTIENKKSQE